MAKGLTYQQKQDYVLEKKIKKTKINLFSKEVSDDQIESADYGILKLFLNVLSEAHLKLSWEKENKGANNV